MAAPVPPEDPDGVRLRSHVSVMGITRVGEGSDLYPGVAIGGDGQIRGNDFADGRLEIGPGCVLREMVSMHLGSAKGGGVTKIGSHTLIMAYAHVGHDSVIGDHAMLVNAATLAGHVIVEEWAVVGALCAVHQFTRIGGTPLRL